MRHLLSGLAAILLFAATPALAGPCKTQGVVDAPIAFPKNDASDVQFARSMVPVMLPAVTTALPATLGCTRATVSTTLGDYVIGGENGDAFPRLAMRADGRPGPIVYLAASPGAPGIVALVLRTMGSRTIVKRFYKGVPTDRLLADDVRAALTDEQGVMAFDADRTLVSYAFVRPGEIPPPVTSGPIPGGGVTAGPQILIVGSGDGKLLDMRDHMRHAPSGFACPATFDGLAVLLMSIDPQADMLVCNYRAGTDLTYRKSDPIRYQIRLMKPPPGETSRSLFEQLVAGARASLRITGNHVPPLATGAAPAPEFVAFWNTEGDGVQGVWVGKAGGWIVWVRAQYPPSAANDAEAGKVARTLFAEIAKQVK